MPSADADEVRDAQRTTWAGLAPSWDKWDALITDQLRPVGETMIERLAVADDQQHLDVAAGTGEPGLSVARRAPNGRVVLTDLAPEMLEVAARRARAEGLDHVELQTCSADDLPFPDATFDSVSVRFGYMFFPDPGLATSELVRVLAPGGRLAASVWVEPGENPWTRIVMDAIATETVVAPPDPGRPHMFRCAAPGLVRSWYEDAGLHDVVEWDVAVHVETTSTAEYWDLISEHVSAASAALHAVDGPARERIRTRAMEAAAAYERDGTVRVPGLARCTVGTKPA